MKQIDAGSDNDDNSSDETLSIDKSRPASLDKMIALVANLVERSRGPDLRLQLSSKDYNAVAGGKVKKNTLQKYSYTKKRNIFFRDFHFCINKLRTISIHTKHDI